MRWDQSRDVIGGEEVVIPVKERERESEGEKRKESERKCKG